MLDSHDKRMATLKKREIELNNQQNKVNSTVFIDFSNEWDNNDFIPKT